MLRIDIEAQAGELPLNITLPSLDGTTLIVGPNGAGKSSLLKAILGILRPRRGRIYVDQVPLFDRELSVDLPIEERCIGYVPQSYALFPHMSARDNVAFGVRQEDPRVDELMRQLEISYLADRKARYLSGGESQRVALARALAPDPRLLLLDEPMAALDQIARRKVRSFVSTVLSDLQIPALVVSHDLEDVVALGRRVAVIESGRVAQIGQLGELRDEPASPFVREFCGASA